MGQGSREREVSTGGRDASKDNGVDATVDGDVKGDVPSRSSLGMVHINHDVGAPLNNGMSPLKSMQLFVGLGDRRAVPRDSSLRLPAP